MKTVIRARLTLLAVAAVLMVHTTRAATYTYTGNGQADVNGAIGAGTMTLTDSGTTIRGTVNLGGSSPGSWANYLILYIDSQPGGFTTTVGFSDVTGPVTKSISGFSSAGRATANFAPGFAADYAIVLSRSPGSTHMLYQLANGSALGPSKNITFTDNGSSIWTFSFSLADIGATSPYFKFQSTVTGSVGTGYRYLESYESVTGIKGFNTVNFNNYSTFGVDPVPEPTNIALAVFGGVVVLGGTVSYWRQRNRANMQS